MLDPKPRQQGGTNENDGRREIDQSLSLTESLYYSWSKEFLKAGKRRPAGATARAATTDEVRSLRHEVRDMKVSDATFYKWRSQYGGMEVSQAQKSKALEEENAKLKKLLAESMMDASTLREMLSKNF